MAPYSKTVALRKLKRFPFSRTSFQPSKKKKKSSNRLGMSEKTYIVCIGTESTFF